MLDGSRRRLWMAPTKMTAQQVTECELAHPTEIWLTDVLISTTLAWKNKKKSEPESQKYRTACDLPTSDNLLTAFSAKPIDGC